MTGIQIGAISFVDEGTEKVLDTVRDLAAVDTVFIATQAFDRGLAGRQITGRPHPGHGPEDLSDVHLGGSFVQQHEKFYRTTVLGPHRAADPDVDGFDALGDVIPAARERNMKVYSFVFENTHSGLTRHIPGWTAVLQEDAWGRADAYACLRNPDYIAWWLALVEDQLKSYDLDGVMWGSERNGPLGNVIGDGGFARNGGAYCFCRHCEAAGQARGVDPSRARLAYQDLFRLTHGLAPQTGDSRYVRFLRLLERYPEILAWDALWHDGFERFQARLYGAVKFLAPDVAVGWHVWHTMSWSPLLRAQIDYAERAQYSDFIKPVLYNNCAGYRLHDHIAKVQSALFENVDPQTVYDLYRGVLGWDEAARYEDLPGRGLSPDYVGRETRRAVAAVAGQALVYPGIDVNIPTPAHVKQTEPDDVRASVTQALDAGADGVLLSRKYSEMPHANLRAAGEVIRDRA